MDHYPVFPSKYFALDLSSLAIVARRLVEKLAISCYCNTAVHAYRSSHKIGISINKHKLVTSHRI